MLHDNSTDEGAGRPFHKICGTMYMTGLHEFMREKWDVMQSKEEEERAGRGVSQAMYAEH